MFCLILDPLIPNSYLANLETGPVLRNLMSQKGVSAALNKKFAENKKLLELDFSRGPCYKNTLKIWLWSNHGVKS